MRNYLEKLKMQFFNATGVKVDFKSGMNVGTFKYWLELNQIISDEYIDLLDSMNLDYKNSNAIETDKGNYDSIVKPFDTTILTPYTPFDEKVKEDRIIKGELDIYKGVPIRNIKLKDSEEYIKMSNDSIDTFMTQNPYNYYNIENWEELHNSGNYGIIVGVYGTLYDDDIENKINELKILKNKILFDDYLESYETDHNNYFYVIASKSLSKTLQKKEIK